MKGFMDQAHFQSLRMKGYYDDGNQRAPFCSADPCFIGRVSVFSRQKCSDTPCGQCHSNKKNIAKGRVFQMEGGMPALLPMEAGKSAFDDARAEAQATGRQQRLGITEISEQARMQAGQLAGLDDGELIAGGVQHMQSMAKTEAIRIEVGLQG